MVVTVSCPPECTATATRSNRRPAKAPSRHRLWHAQSPPLDPDELTRRLHLVLAEQHAHAQTTGANWPKDNKEAQLTDKSRSWPIHGHTTTKDKHRARLDGAASDMSTPAPRKEHERNHCSGYRHIPQVAASQFALTTTVDSPTDRELVHQLSKKAIKFHLDGPNASRHISVAKPDAWPLQQAQALRRVQIRRERQYERNKCLNTSGLAAMPEVDEQAARLPQRHTFEAYFTTKGDDHDDQRDLRRKSMGAILGSTDAPPVESFKMAPAFLLNVEGLASTGVVSPSDHHPVDWTQSDEIRAGPMPMATSPHALRKPESKWTLRGRLGSFARHGRDEKMPSPPLGEHASQELPPKSLPKGGFFARFKR